MTADAFRRWLEGYVDAWRSYHPGAIASLFAERAEYRYHPWDDPVVGAEAIAASWSSDRDAPGSWEASYEPWAIDGDRAVAIGTTRYLDPGGTVEREYHNVFLCSFDESGRCRSFTELYARRPDEVT